MTLISDVHNAEFILTGVLRQQLDFTSYPFQIVLLLTTYKLITNNAPFIVILFKSYCSRSLHLNLDIVSKINVANILSVVELTYL